MRAIVVTANGGPEVLELRDVPVPEPGPGELLVEIEATGVNYRDIYEREGNYPGTPPPPHGAGVEGAGTIAAVGPDVTEHAAGERVAWIAGQGSYAEQVVLDQSRAVPVPDGLSSELAAASLLQGMTAHYLATSTYPVEAGDDAVVHAAAGGVGLLLTQIVKLRGGHVIATTSTDEKGELAREAGADEVLGYEGFGERVRALTGGAGAAVVYDGIGQATFDDSIASLRPRGCMVCYGAASGPPPPLDIQRLNVGGSLYLTRPSLPHYVAERSELLRRAEEVFAWIADGSLDVRIGQRYPLADGREAQKDLAARRTVGKLLLVPGAVR